MAHTINIDIIDRFAPQMDHSNIPIINKPNPCYGYAINAQDLYYLMQFAKYYIYEAGTNKIINSNNYYDYFPEEQPGGGEIVEEVLVGPPTLIEKSITENGVYNASDDEADGYSSVTVEVSGGGAGGFDVVFYDYDGTIVTTYSAADFANLSAMPENPTHEGLTAQGWNWSLADAKTYVAANGKLNIGQMYITSDGKTRLYYVIPKDSLTLNLYLALDEDTELDIDWGDGTEHTTWTSNDGDGKPHGYSVGGRYTVSITVVSGGFSCDPSGSDDYTLKKVEFGSSVTSIGSSAFYECHALSSITIPNNVTNIGDNSFYNCHALSSITIPSSVTNIEMDAFYECHALSSITLPSSVISIGMNAFYNCYALSSITIPDSVESIGDNSFYNCYALSSITIPDSVESIGDYAFSSCYALSSITIPSSVEHVGSSAFYECYALSSITISDGVTSIGMNAFYNCYALSSITIPGSVTNIEAQAFCDCHALSSITISDGVTSIDNSAFYNCYALSSITIPDSVTSIYAMAFYDCLALSSITFESTTPPEIIGGNLPLPETCIIRVPQGTLSDYTSASNYPDPNSYTYEEY